MDAEGCAAGWVRDTLVYSNNSLSSSLSACTLNMAFFNAFVSIIALLQLANLVIRTRYLLHRSRITRRPLVRAQYITMLCSLTTFVTVVIFLALPNSALGTPHNSMFCLMGIVLFLFNFDLLRWVGKIQRLGHRLILKRLPTPSPTVASGAAAITALKLAASQSTDSALVAMLAVGYAICLVQLVCMCVLSVVFYKSAVWPQASLGLNATFLCIVAALSVQQTGKCRTTIRTTRKQVGSMLSTDALDKYREVERKFRTQQIVVALFGAVGALVCALAAGGVIPIDHALILTGLGFDAVSTLVMLASVLTLCCCGRRRGGGAGDGEDGGRRIGEVNADGGGVGGTSPTPSSPLAIRQLNSKTALSSSVLVPAVAAVNTTTD